MPPVEFIRLPPLDTSHASKAQHWDRSPFLTGELGGVIQLRTEVLRAVFEMYKPHAMITDMFALGKGCELLPHLRSAGDCLNYLLLRGVIGNERYMWTRVFSPQSVLVLRRHYHRLLVACDQRVFDASEYGLPSDIMSKAENVGYVLNCAELNSRDSVRQSKSIAPKQVWVVCAAGGGLSSEPLLERCLEVAKQMNACKFTIVLGPHSRLALNRSVALPAHIKIVSHQHRLNILLSACDVAVIHGGYNSLLESASSGASVLVVPNDGEEEQQQHARRISLLADVRVSTLGNLAFDIQDTVHRRIARPSPSIPTIDLAGADKIHAIVCNDLKGQPRRKADLR